MTVGTTADMSPILRLKWDNDEGGDVYVTLDHLDDGYHTYQMTPSSTYATTKNVDIYVDGVLVYEGYTGDVNYDELAGGNRFGVLYSGDSGGALYSYVSLETPGQIIPEPMTLAVLALGGLAALIRRRR